MSDDTTNQLEFVLQDVNRRIARLYNRIFEQAGVSRVQASALVFLQHEGVRTQTELANRMEMSRAAMGALLDRMETSGLVERLHSQRDKRVNYLKITDKARPIVAKIDELTSQTGPLIRDGTTKEERREAIAFLSKIKKNVEREEARLEKALDK